MPFLEADLGLLCFGALGQPHTPLLIQPPTGRWLGLGCRHRDLAPRQQ